jgi:hypothetical protein
VQFEIIACFGTAEDSLARRTDSFDAQIIELKGVVRGGHGVLVNIHPLTPFHNVLSIMRYDLVKVHVWNELYTLSSTALMGFISCMHTPYIYTLRAVT